jgi:hypothetical protein
MQKQMKIISMISEHYDKIPDAMLSSIEKMLWDQLFGFTSIPFPEMKIKFYDSDLCSVMRKQYNEEKQLAFRYDSETGERTQQYSWNRKIEYIRKIREFFNNDRIMCTLSTAKDLVELYCSK